MAKSKKKGKALTPYQRKLKQMRVAEKNMDDMKFEAAKTAVMTLYIMLLYTMYFFYGWKQKRLTRILMQYKQIYDAVVAGDRTLEQLADELRHEANLDIDVKSGKVKIKEEN